jgi:hypothetical protein
MSININDNSEINKEITGKDLMIMLGYDKITPIHLSPSSQKDIDDNNDFYSKWLENELLTAYQES